MYEVTGSKKYKMIAYPCKHLAGKVSVQHEYEDDRYSLEDTSYSNISNKLFNCPEYKVIYYQCLDVPKMCYGDNGKCQKIPGRIVIWCYNDVLDTYIEAYVYQRLYDVYADIVEYVSGIAVVFHDPPEGISRQKNEEGHVKQVDDIAQLVHTIVIKMFQAVPKYYKYYRQAF